MKADKQKHVSREVDPVAVKVAKQEKRHRVYQEEIIEELTRSGRTLKQEYDRVERKESVLSAGARKYLRWVILNVENGRI